MSRPEIAALIAAGHTDAATEEQQDTEGWAWRLETATADTPDAIPYTHLGLG